MLSENNAGQYYPDYAYNHPLFTDVRELESRPNFMTVPAAIRELEKIEMVRLTNNRYRLDHAVTATQKTILKAFGMDANVIKYCMRFVPSPADGLDHISR